MARFDELPQEVLDLLFYHCSAETVSSLLSIPSLQKRVMHLFRVITNDSSPSATVFSFFKNPQYIRKLRFKSITPNTIHPGVIYIIDGTDAIDLFKNLSKLRVTLNKARLFIVIPLKEDLKRTKPGLSKSELITKFSEFLPKSRLVIAHHPIDGKDSWYNLSLQDNDIFDPNRFEISKKHGFPPVILQKGYQFRLSHKMEKLSTVTDPHLFSAEYVDRINALCEFPLTKLTLHHHFLTAGTPLNIDFGRVKNLNLKEIHSLQNVSGDQLETMEIDFCAINATVSFSYIGAQIVNCITSTSTKHLTLSTSRSNREPLRCLNTAGLNFPQLQSLIIKDLEVGGLYVRQGAIRFAKLEYLEAINKASFLHLSTPEVIPFRNLTCMVLELEDWQDVHAVERQPFPNLVLLRYTPPKHQSVQDEQSVNFGYPQINAPKLLELDVRINERKSLADLNVTFPELRILRVSQDRSIQEDTEIMLHSIGTDEYKNLECFTIEDGTNINYNEAIIVLSRASFPKLHSFTAYFKPRDFSLTTPFLFAVKMPELRMLRIKMAGSAIPTLKIDCLSNLEMLQIEKETPTNIVLQNLSNLKIIKCSKPTFNLNTEGSDQLELVDLKPNRETNTELNFGKTKNINVYIRKYDTKDIPKSDAKMLALSKKFCFKSTLRQIGQRACEDKIGEVFYYDDGLTNGTVEVKGQEMFRSRAKYLKKRFGF